ncbi:MAG: YitT family protein [Tepidibacillus sp.]
MQLFSKAIAILLGSLILAVGINFFLVPFHLLDGGMIGIALIVNYLSGLKVGLTIILLSIPIYLLTWFKYRSFFYHSIHGMLISSLFIDVLRPYQYYFLYYVELDPLSSSIIGGLFVGTGIGIMLRFKTSTGGTDLLAQYLSTILPINVGLIIFMIDAIVIYLGGVLISKETLILSFITIMAVGVATSLLTWKQKKVVK